MGRLTDALKRSRSATAGSLPVDAGDGNQIQFFDPKQPAAAIPWNIGERPERPRQVPVPVPAPPPAAPPVAARLVAVAPPPVVVTPPSVESVATPIVRAARPRREPRPRQKPKTPEALPPH